jgi:hypothetical protein
VGVFDWTAVMNHHLLWFIQQALVFHNSRGDKSGLRVSAWSHPGEVLFQIVD